MIDLSVCRFLVAIAVSVKEMRRLALDGYGHNAPLQSYQITILVLFLVQIWSEA